MTAILEHGLTPEYGSMTPRVYTPPLKHHRTGPKPDPFFPGSEPEECPCGCGLNPETSWGFSCNEFAKYVLRRNLLPYQKWLNIHALEKGDDDGGFRFKILVVLISRQQGKALDRATPILTTNGWSTMGELQLGDEVFHPDGTPTRVLGAFDQPDGRTCFEVTSTDGRSIVADAEHLWTVQDVRRTRKGSYQWETLTTAELLERGLARDQRGRERAFRLPTQAAIQSKPVELPIEPYILGSWLGDGTSAFPIISAGDEDVSETINNLLGAGAQLVSVIRRKTCWAVRINVGGGMRDGFEARCRKLGIWGAKAIPDLYLTAGTEQRLALLQGLLDSDGHITAAGQVEFSSTNRNIVDGAHYLARSLGFRPGRVCEGVARLNGRDCGPKYRFRFTPDNSGPIPFRMARKAARIKDHPMHNRGRQIVSIDSIREVPSRPVRCIKVDREDGLFLAGRDLMPTHNTFWLQQLGLWRLFISPEGHASRECPGAKLALIAAQNLQYAEGVLKEVVDEIRDSPSLSKELINHRVTNGNHRAILKNRRYWRAATASRKGGRSLSVDIAMLDELREHVTTDAFDAIVPTTLVRPYSQVVCTSNAGDARSEVLRNLRDPAARLIQTNETEDTRTGLFEWSVPQDVDPRDDQYWHLANPAVGHLNNFKLSDLRAMFEAQQYRNLPGFQTEHLALDITTPILTTSGWKTMETVEVGDQVYHPDGHPIEVSAVTPIYTDRSCYQVETTDGRSVVCDTEHRWTVVDRRRGGGKRKALQETLSTEKLLARGVGRNKSGGKYAYQLPRQHQIISKPADLPIDPYLLGAWLGDGTPGKAEITCIENDADELTTLLPATVTSVRSAGNARRINFRITPRKSRDGFPARCRDLGIWTDKHIPDVYLTAGTEQRLALLQGLCDTDGSIDSNGRVRFCSVRKTLAEQVLYLARSLGWRATLSEGVSSFNGVVRGPAYWVGWTHDAAESPPFRLRRKLTRINTRPSRAGERTAISIRSITSVATRPVRCITVDSPDSLFLAGRGLTPTANCQWVDSLEPGIIPVEHWAETRDKVSRPRDDAKIYAGLDVNYERSKSYISVAARRDDGELHIEVIAAARGTDWVIPWFRDNKNTTFEGVAVQKTGAPASGMIEDMRRAGIPVREWGPALEVTGGSTAFYDGIVEHKIKHRPGGVLDRAAASGISRNVGESWVFDRRNSPVDVSPIISCAAAVWLEHQPPEGAPDIMPWPSEETMKQWEAEADDKFRDAEARRDQFNDTGETSWWTT